MIKDILSSNTKVTPNGKSLAVLREQFPACFTTDGGFDIERFKEYLSAEVAVINEGYELRFLGKNYARLLASLDTTTVIVPDEEHNSKPENTDSKNVYISGDNLDGLKHLLKSYENKVKCIYIDPPYNTGLDGFAYKDSFKFTAEELSDKLSISDEQAKRILDLTKRGSASHSAWLMFMYPRLLLARDLLTDDGVILISIDENEFKNLGLLCDDVFGEQNFVECLVYDKKAAPKGVPPTEMVVGVHEYIYAYARNKSKFHFIGKPRNPEDFSNPDNDPRGPWRNTNIRSTTSDISYTIEDPANGNLFTDTWAYCEEEMQELISEGRVIFPPTQDGQVRGKEFFKEFGNSNIPRLYR